MSTSVRKLKGKEVKTKETESVVEKLAFMNTLFKGEKIDIAASMAAAYSPVATEQEGRWAFVCARATHKSPASRQERQPRRGAPVAERHGLLHLRHALTVRSRTHPNAAPHSRTRDVLDAGTSHASTLCVTDDSIVNHNDGEIYGAMRVSRRQEHSRPRTCTTFSNINYSRYFSWHLAYKQLKCKQTTERASQTLAMLSFVSNKNI
ncbi:hypothetical protein FI667_g15108, partial [Globisporangium splendens]